MSTIEEDLEHLKDAVERFDTTTDTYTKEAVVRMLDILRRIHRACVDHDERLSKAGF